MLLVAGLMAQLAPPGCAAENRVLVRARKKVLKDAKEEDAGLSRAGSSPPKKFVTEVAKKKHMKGDTSFLKAFPGKSINIFTNFPKHLETVQFRFMLVRTFGQVLGRRTFAEHNPQEAPRKRDKPWLLLWSDACSSVQGCHLRAFAACKDPIFRGALKGP